MNVARLLLLSFVLVFCKGVLLTGQSQGKLWNSTSRIPREIRRGNRDRHLFVHSTNEPRTPRNMLFLRNRPLEPLHGLYRKGFAHRHVPDFHRQPLEESRVASLRVNQSLDEIISGIIHLLGGDVHVTSPQTKLTTSSAKPFSKPTRINNRGPSHFFENRIKDDVVPSVNSTKLIEVTSTKEIATSTMSTIQTSSKWLFPDDKDVSYILGLLNYTTTQSTATTENTPTSNSTTTSISRTTAGSVLQTSTRYGLVEVSPSETNDSPISSTVSSSPMGSIEENRPSSSSYTQTVGGPLAIDTTSDFLIEIQPSVTIFTTESVTTDTDKDTYAFEVNPTADLSFPELPINSSRQPFIPTSASTSEWTTSSNRLSPSFTFPTGAITDWLPVAVLPSRYSKPSVNRTRVEEPVIITIATEPSHFEMTVTQQMGPSINRSAHRETTHVTSQHETAYHETTQRATQADDTTRASTSPATTIVTSTYNVPAAPTEAIISTRVDIVYGRPTMAIDPPPTPTGKPHVFAVDISQVRPSKRPGPYQRPRYPLTPNAGNSNGLKPIGALRPASTPPKRPQVYRPPPDVPEVRIDTCVVGDDSTCDVQLHEHCRTERGVSSCLCRPGFGRAVQRGVCSPVVSMLLTLKVAKVGDQSIDPTFLIPGSPDYKRLLLEANQAMATVFAYSPLAEAFRGTSVNRLTFLANRMVVNSTVHLAEAEVRGSLRHHIEHAVSASISRRSNQIGDSRLYVSGPLSALVEVEDLNECSDKEMNDCSTFAVCENLFGTFQCTCSPGYTDKAATNIRTAGRLCSACSPDYCWGRGKCMVVNGKQECRCRGNYSGARCQIDNEVVGVSVGVSLIAVIVIAITAVCLYMWNRRWKQAQQKSDAAKHVGYRLQTLADHVRWGAAAGPMGSTYVPADPPMRLPPPPPPPITPSASQLYSMPTLPMSNRQERRYIYEDDINPYGRIIRTLQKTANNQHHGMHYDTLSSECASSEEMGFPSVPSNSFIYHGSFPERGYR